MQQQFRAIPSRDGILSREGIPSRDGILSREGIPSRDRCAGCSVWPLSPDVA